MLLLEPRRQIAPPTASVLGCAVMLWFEREVVGALTDSPDQPLRSSVESFVDGSLRDMPEHLRAGVAGESVLLGDLRRRPAPAGRLPDGPTPTPWPRCSTRWETAPSACSASTCG